MKSTILRYGLYAAIFETVFFILYWLVFKVQITPENCHTQEVIGYLEILVSLSFVYFGVRYYRDMVNNHVVTFGKALAIGLLISLVPAVVFGLLDHLYSAVIDPNFLEKWSAIQIAELKRTTPAPELPAKLKKLNEDITLYKNPFLGWLVMFSSVMAMGVIVSIVSALILKRKTVKTT